MQIYKKKISFVNSPIYAATNPHLLAYKSLAIFYLENIVYYALIDSGITTSRIQYACPNAWNARARTEMASFY